MVETEYRLEESRTVTIAANGIGSITGIGPTKPGERWEIRNTSVTATGECTFADYYGNAVNSKRQIDYTRSGIGDSSDTVIKLQPQETVSCAFEGTAGIIGTVVFTGSRFVPGRRAY
jgi:hypothetical protein